MQATIEELSPVERKLTFQLDGKQVAQQLDRAYEAMSTQVRLPGFPPGPLPRAVLEQRYKTQVEAEVFRGVMQGAFAAAVQQHQLKVVAPPSFVLHAPALPAFFRFEAKVEVKPLVVPRNWKGLPVQKAEPAPVTDADVAAQLESVQKMLGTFEKVSLRKVAKAGDYALVDLEGTCDGKPFPGSAGKDVMVEIGPGDLLERQIAALDGVTVGQGKTVEYVFPPHAAAAELRGRKATFKIQLKALRVRVLPKLDDELARKAGKYKTLQELKEAIRADLKAQRDADAALQQRARLLDALIERNPVDAPPALVERVLTSLFDSAMRGLVRHGVDPRGLNRDLGQVRETLRPQAVREAKADILLEALAEAEKLQPSADEVRRLLDASPAMAGGAIPPEQLPFLRAQLEQQLRQAKAYERLQREAKPS